MEDEARYCLYCKEEIGEKEASVTDDKGRVYHSRCYVQMNTYTDEDGEVTYYEYE